MNAEDEYEDLSPKYDGDAFECPFCGVYATQGWKEILSWGVTEKGQFYRGWKWSECRYCRNVALWSHKKVLAYPTRQFAGPEPNADMPEDVLALYEEARAVLPVSPRSTAALLRLALQRLIDTLEPGKKSIHHKIGGLVKRGLEPQAQKAMDVLRVVGNNSVHPGDLSVDEDAALVPALFRLLNLIVHHVISRPREVDSLFDSLPDGARKAIEQRDAGKGKDGNFPTKAEVETN